MSEGIEQVQVLAPPDHGRPLAIPNDHNQTPTLSKIGYVLTGVWLVFMIIMAIAAWDKMLSMQPNEFGDMLAGVFAPLAFLWLVLGFLQQGKELQASVVALQFQAEELRNSVEQQRDLVQATRDGIARDMEVAQSERNYKEFSAQPILIGEVVEQHFGNTDAPWFRFSIGNAGADVTNVRVVQAGKLAKKQSTLPKGKDIAFTGKYKSREDLTEISGFIEYDDALGNRRARGFRFPLKPHWGPFPNEFDEPVIDETLYKPPFPWDLPAEN